MIQIQGLLCASAVLSTFHVSILVITLCSEGTETQITQMASDQAGIQTPASDSVRYPYHGEVRQVLPLFL